MSKVFGLSLIVFSALLGQTRSCPSDASPLDHRPASPAAEAPAAKPQAAPPQPSASPSESTPPKDPPHVAVPLATEKGAFVMDAPEDVPLAKTLFDPADDLAARLEKWKASSGKKSFHKKILVEKAKRLLTVFADADAIVKYPVELGFGPVDDKVKQGDGATPEREIYIATRNKDSKFHRFLGLSYPQPDDAKRGFSTGMITAAQRDAILSAHRAKTVPPWNTALGGAVGI